ncbi:glycosyltransferase family 2 protein [Acinetobacter sp. WCHAc010052]|uniref:glycosyltransferase family 2 protein n=1 Tax=Acinetobacter sp. WCHAc010052 TaxID=2004647 RepID=UPI000B3C7804|nr:glycosyltransferase family 2 protein [Acinetobacter sp. WCHAc010052]AXY61095.1 glycosyltransferase family 2 protein [Acinetobacter sp. WCHAc010052]
MQLSILIVNYNTEKFIEQFLLDLTQQTLPHSEYEVIITNNVQNSTLHDTLQQNSSLEQISLKIIASETNIGFGRAMNLAASHAQGEHLLIANPDLRMLQNDYLEKLLNQAETYNNYGVITTQQINDDQKDTSEYHQYEFGHTIPATEQSSEAVWFCGALMLLKKSVYEKISGFDPDFFMYCEDEDLCLRVKKLNLPLVKINELKIYHKGGSSEPLKNYAFYHRWFRSQVLFAYKHYPESEFQQLLEKLETRSRKKSFLYYLLSFTGNKKYISRKEKWAAMLDCVRKTRQESVEWLYFK